MRDFIIGLTMGILVVLCNPFPTKNETRCIGTVSNFTISAFNEVCH